MPTILLNILSAFTLHRRPTEDMVCKNCGGLHHTIGCDLFALVFKSDLPDSAASRHGRERSHSVSRSRSRSVYRGHPTSRARSEQPETRKPATNVSFVPAAAEKKACHQFLKNGSCSFGSNCRYKH